MPFYPKEIISLIISMMRCHIRVYCGSTTTTFIIDGDVYTCGNNDVFLNKKIFKQGKIDLIYHGKNHTIFVDKSKKTVYSWGKNYYGKLGLGDDMDRNVPQQIMFDFGSKIMMITGGENYTVIVTESGESYGWGLNHYGQLGLADGGNRYSPSKLPITNVKTISCGKYHTIILSKDECFGCGKNNRWGQYSLQKIIIRGKFGESVPITISCGSYHTVALTSDGVYSWGENKYGQLGLGHFEERTVPQKVDLSNINIISISCGDDYTMILTSNGELFACGDNRYGQLGVCWPKKINIKQRQFKFQKINWCDSGTNWWHNGWKNEFVLSVTCGGYHTIVMTSSGKYYCWGNNERGQLGLADTNNRYKKTEMIIKI